MLPKHIQHILKLTVTRFIIINSILCIGCVLANQYKQTNKMLIDFDYLVSQLYVQHCTFVEIGEGVCSLFIELTLDTGSSCKKPTTGQMFFGNCLCSEFRGWQLCSHQLTLQRPDDCVFEEGVDCPSSSARVHRRLCDITGMSQWNSQCNCSVPLAGMQQEPLCGFRTCFSNPMPASVCTPRTVCGTARCDISLHGSLYAIKCDRRCKDHQSFCEQSGPTTSDKRIVTSEWTDWQSLCSEDKASIQQYEAECLDTEGKPAFDCIGPGLLCCGLEEVDCICEVKLEDGHLKVFRYIIAHLGSKESEHLSLKVRSVGLNGQAKVWNRFMDLVSKEDESNSLFSSPKLKGKNKETLQLKPLRIGKLDQKGNKMNVHANRIIYENISQLLGSTLPSYTKLIATAVSNENLQHNEHCFFKQQSELITLSSIIEKQEKNHNLMSSEQNLGGLRNNSFRKEKENKINLPSDKEKSNALGLGTNMPISIDDTETHELIKEEISSYHFTSKPNALPKKLSTITENTAYNQNKKSLDDRIVNKNITTVDETHDSVLVKENGTNNDNEENLYPNKENKYATNGNKESLKQTLQISNSDNDDVNPETNEENKHGINKDISRQIGTNKLQENEKYTESILKNSLTDNELPMEQSFFQNEIDYNSKSSDVSKKDFRNKTLKNDTLDVINNSSISYAKPNLQSVNSNFTQQNISSELKRNISIPERGNVNKYTTPTEGNLTFPYFVSEFTLSIIKNSPLSTTDGKTNSAQQINNERNIKKTNDLSNITEANEGKIMPLTNKTNLDTKSNIDKNMHSNDKNSSKTKENKSTNLANSEPDTRSLSEECTTSTVAKSDSTTACITIKLDDQLKPNMSNKFNSTTDIPTITNFNSISQSKNWSSKNQETPTLQLKSTQAPRYNIKEKITNSKENILIDQKEALRTASNLNPTLALEEDQPKSQTSLYDEPEPVLKDLDKDVVDDNMADVLNNMIGMKHYHDKLTWTEQQDKNKKVSLKEDKVINSKNTKHGSPSKGFASNKGGLETKEHPVKTRKTKKKIH